MVSQALRTLSRRRGQRRALTGECVAAEPLLPGKRVVRPFLLLDAPAGWHCWQEELMTLLGGQTAGRSSLCNGHNFLGAAGKNSQQPRRVVLRRGDDALAVGAERRAPHSIRMAHERLADLLAALGVPQPRRVVGRRGDDALAVGAERRALHTLRVARERLADLLAALGVPQPRRFVGRRGDDALAVGANL